MLACYRFAFLSRRFDYICAHLPCTPLQQSIPWVGMVFGPIVFYHWDRFEFSNISLSFVQYYSWLTYLSFWSVSIPKLIPKTNLILACYSNNDEIDLIPLVRTINIFINYRLNINIRKRLTTAYDTVHVRRV